MIELRITGECADEIWDHLQDLNKVVDFWHSPFEYNGEGKVVAYNRHIAKSKEGTPAAETARTEYADQPKDVVPATSAAEKSETKTATAATEPTSTAKEISDEDIRKAYAGNKEKTAKAKKWKAEKSLKSLTSMDQEQRKEFLAYMNA